MFESLFNFLNPYKRRCKECKCYLPRESMFKVIVRDPLSWKYGDFFEYYCSNHNPGYDFYKIGKNSDIKGKIINESMVKVIEEIKYSK